MNQSDPAKKTISSCLLVVLSSLHNFPKKIHTNIALINAISHFKNAPDRFHDLGTTSCDSTSDTCRKSASARKSKFGVASCETETDRQMWSTRRARCDHTFNCFRESSWCGVAASPAYIGARNLIITVKYFLNFEKV